MKKVFLLFPALLLLLLSGCSPKAQTPEEVITLLYKRLLNNELEAAGELVMPGIDLSALRDYRGYLSEPEKTEIRAELLHKNDKMALLEVYLRRDQEKPAKVMMVQSEAGWKFQYLIR